MTETDLLSHAEYMELEGADPRRKHGRRFLGFEILELVLGVGILITLSLWVLIGLAIAALV